ncbi:2-oxoglutarate-dependent dioxygenase 19-like [Humulus lupulus]|uniref:2-oxoglutarate-dependent dioxygenase 19-like n=1 Tax=Humulus lupulus TaxID=3486 RepID=UPI002B404423|nr:2-oxoglutarate-dependent dioxygenase 19-like [Humulus lupulus]
MATSGVVSVNWSNNNNNSRVVKSKYEFAVKPSDEEVVVDSDDSEYSIPTIDISLLTSPDHHQRSKILHHLHKACQEWGFFQLINHGISETVMKQMMEACEGFFNMSEEEKKEFQGSRDVLDPINWGTNFNCNTVGKKFLIWREFLKLYVHPQFNSPYKPLGFSEAAEEYCKRTREICRVLMRAMSEALGLEPNCLEKATNWDEGCDVLASNYYPTCPNPDQVIGLPPHTDPGLMNLLVQNDVGGLQILHKSGKWVQWKAMPNTIIVDLGDQMQILTNDLYKSVTHRAVVNNKSTRISIVSGHGPAVNAKVVPIPELLEALGQAPAYPGIPYNEYLQLQRTSHTFLKSTLDIIRLES